MSWSFIEWLLGILGVIFLGALGSGLWTLILEKPTKKLGGILFSIVTLGLTSLKNNLYAEVARPCKERTARFILMVLLGIALACSIGYISYFAHDPFSNPQIKTLIQVTSDPNATKEQIQQAKKDFQVYGEEVRTKGILLGSFLFVWTMSFLLWNYIKFSFIDSYRAYLEQACNICMPYFKPQEYNKLLSDIAQIQNKDNFTRVKIRLEEIASRGEIKLPYVQIN